MSTVPGFVVYIKAALALVLIKMTSLFKFMTNILVIMKIIITFTSDINTYRYEHEKYSDATHLP